MKKYALQVDNADQETDESSTVNMSALNSELKPSNQTAPSPPSTSPFGSPLSSPSSRSIAPLGSARRRSKTPTQRQPTSHSSSPSNAIPSFSDFGHSDSRGQSSLLSSPSRGRGRPKTWAGRTPAELRPLWKPGSPVRPLSSTSTEDQTCSRGGGGETPRGRSLGRGLQEEEKITSLSSLSLRSPSTLSPSSKAKAAMSEGNQLEIASIRASSSLQIAPAQLASVELDQAQDSPHSLQHGHDSHSHSHSHGHSHSHSHSEPAGIGGTERPRRGEVDSEEERDQAKERAHFLSVLEAFDQYLPYCVSIREQSIYVLKDCLGNVALSRG